MSDDIVSARRSLASAMQKSAVPSIGANHPGALCAHALLDVMAIVRADPALISDLDLGAATELLTDATVHLGALCSLFEHQERAIEELRVETLNAKDLAKREKEYSTHIEEENSRLIRRLELLAGEQARDELAAIRAVTSSNEPRIAAAGA